MNSPFTFDTVVVCLPSENTLESLPLWLYFQNPVDVWTLMVMSWPTDLDVMNVTGCVVGASVVVVVVSSVKSKPSKFQPLSSKVL